MIQASGLAMDQSFSNMKGMVHLDVESDVVKRCGSVLEGPTFRQRDELSS